MVIASRCLVVGGLLLAGCSSPQQTASSPETPTQKAEPATASPEAAPQGAESGASHEPGPVGTQLLRDVNDSPDKYEIAQGPGTGMAAYSVLLNGAPLWPPQGEGCEQLVQCCDDLGALSESLALACLLATGRDRKCDTARATAIEIAKEQSYEIPKSCTP